MAEGSPEKVFLNIGGIRLETYCTTLRSFPGTRLCSLADPQALENVDYDPDTKEVFLDRSAKLFGQVLGYCRTGHLHCPADVCSSALTEELAFWEIPLGQLPPCCWAKLSEPEGPLEEYKTEATEEEEEDRQVLLGPVDRRSGPRWAWSKPQIRALLEEPFSSRGALCLAIVSLLLNVGLIVLFCEETYVLMRYSNDTASEAHWMDFSTITKYQAMPFLLYLELAIILWFTVEFALRLALCPDKKTFLGKPLNVVDALAVFPVYLQLLLRRHWVREIYLAAWLDFFRILYILKLLKVFRLVETPLMLRILPYIFRSLLRETLILVIILAFEVLLSGALFYYAERFEDIPTSLWWAVITLTGVGYGDVHPVSPWGQVVGACTAFCGVLTLLLPIPIFSVKFKGYYDVAVVKEKRKTNKEPTS